MTLIDILTFVGSIGLFLYGTKLLSEGLQKIAGDNIRDILARMTRNRFTGVLNGFFLTTLVQSSSATTLMIVSFVNAGFISLAEAMAVVMGANVGTTTTTWIISALGFKFDVSLFIFPLIALSLPLFQSGHSRRNAWGELIIGLGLLFLGIDVLKGIVPEASQSAELFSSISGVVTSGMLSVLLFVFLGILLTMAVQASSALVFLAMLLCVGGWIPYYDGYALIIGANIGTCIMPLIVSRSAHTMAKRVAMGHLLFNVSAAVWALLLFWPFCHLIDTCCVALGIGFPEDPDNVALGMSLFHTVFNFVNLCLLLPLTKPFVRLVTRIVPERENHEEAFKLQFISSGMISSGEMSLVQVCKETARYSNETYKMFTMVCQMLAEPLGSARQLQLNDRIRAMEEESDRAEMEIADFLNKISPKTLSLQGEQQCRNLYKIVDELESIADSIYHLSATLYAKSEQLVRFSPELNENVKKMFSLTDIALKHMLYVLEMDEVPANALNKAYNYEDEINNFRNQFRNAVLDQFDRQEVEYHQSTFFMMIINECEKIGDYVINVVTAACEK